MLAKRHLRLSLIALLSTFALVACDNDDDSSTAETGGMVFVMTNQAAGNAIVAYRRDNTGALTLVGEYSTNGNGGVYDGGEGLDPLVAANSLAITNDRQYLLAVNAGSDTVSLLRINSDASLTFLDQAESGGDAPNSVATYGDLVYVSNIDAEDADRPFTEQEGSLQGFRISNDGKLNTISNSVRELGNRPSALAFTDNGYYLIVSSSNAGSRDLASNSQNEFVSYRVALDGRLSVSHIGAATSTLRDNSEGRNLPTAIGFRVTQRAGNHFIVASEGREFRPDGQAPQFDTLQSGSVSVFSISGDGSLALERGDIMVGTDANNGQRTSCWVTLSPTEDYFWVSNSFESTLSSFSIDDDMNAALMNEEAASGEGPAGNTPDQTFSSTDGFIDSAISADGQYFYQLNGLDGSISIYKTDGAELIDMGTAPGVLPDTNMQGLVAF